MNNNKHNKKIVMTTITPLLFLLLLSFALAAPPAPPESPPGPGGLPNPNPEDPELPTISLSVDNTTVEQGEKIVFNWTTQDANLCQAAGNISGWSGTKPLERAYEELATTNIGQGDYSLGLNCTNNHGSTTQITTITINEINDTTQKDSVLTTNKQVYVPGETIIFELEGFLGNTILLIPQAITNKQITVNKDPYEGNITLDFLAATGLYNFTAASTTNQNMTDTVVINITLPKPKLFVSKNNTATNETIRISGNSFIPQQDITLSITQQSSSSKETISVTSDEDGLFITNYTTKNLGVYTIFATHDLRKDINSTTNFTVGEQTNTTPIPEVECTTNTQCDTGEVCEAGECIEESDPELETCNGCERNGVCYPQGAVIAGEYCAQSSFQAQKNEGASCTANYECQRGLCSQGVCGGQNNQPTTPPPTTNQPTPIVEESSNSFLWWIIIFVIIVGLIGGFIGFLAYEDALDMSSPQGFIDGVKEAFTNSTSAYTPPVHSTNTFSKETLPTKATPNAASMSPHEQKAVGYINQKRAQGYDDLTIRNALLKQGWPEPEVDGVFDKLYK